MARRTTSPATASAKQAAADAAAKQADRDEAVTPLRAEERDTAVAARETQAQTNFTADTTELEAKLGRRPNAREVAKLKARKAAEEQAEKDGALMPDNTAELPPIKPGQKLSLRELNQHARAANKLLREDADDIGRAAGKAARERALGRVSGHRSRFAKGAQALDALRKAQEQAGS